MTKHLLAMLTVLLLCAALSAALAESLPVYRIFDMSDLEAPQLLGSAVLCRDQQTLLTSLPGFAGVDGLIAYGEDGMFEVVSATSFDGMLQLLTISSVSQQQPMQLGWLADPVCVGITSDNLPVSVWPEQVQATIYGNDRYEAQQMTLMDDLMPGAFLTDGKSVSGVVVSRHAEGDARYTVLSIAGIQTLLDDYFGAELGSYPWISHNVEITQDGCYLLIDWSALDLSAAVEGDKVWTIVARPGNCYWEGGSTDLD